MPQVYGWPGAGHRISQRVGILVGVGNPNNSATTDVQLAGQGSLYLQQDGGGALWVCSVAGSPAVNATWVSK
jgi:hypothetical protein